MSTSQNREKARDFSKETKTSDNERKEDFKFSLLIKIEHIWKKDLYPLCFDISKISVYPSEEEFLFNPYSFFKIKNFKVNFNTHVIELKLETINKREELENRVKDNKKIYYNKHSQLLEAKEKTNNEKDESEEEDDKIKINNEEEEEEDNDYGIDDI